MKSPIIINGETITEDMVASIWKQAQVVDIQPGPLGLLRGETPTNGPVFVKTGLVMVTLLLHDGRRLEYYESTPPRSFDPA